MSKTDKISDDVLRADFTIATPCPNPNCGCAGIRVDFLDDQENVVARGELDIDKALTLVDVLLDSVEFIRRTRHPEAPKQVH